MIVLSEYGERQLLNWAVRAAEPTDPLGYLFLFKNDYTPVRTDGIEEFIAADFTGADIKDVDREIFSNPATVGPRAETEGPETPFAWTNTGAAQTVYGYCIMNSAETEWIMADRFAAPRLLNPGDDLDLSLLLTCRVDPGA